MDKQKFYTSVRNDFGPLKQSQVDGFEAILNYWEESKLTDIRWLAYMLATAWHETAKTMQAIEEYGKGKGRKYGKSDNRTGQTYYGRGFVQLTWYDNYRIMGKLIDVDLLNHPALALDTATAVRIMFEGMTTGLSLRGDFTSRHLGMYFNDKKEDPVNARRIINGLDQAQVIATYYKYFNKALTQGDSI